MKAVITQVEAKQLEQQTRGQADDEDWRYKRRKGVTASRAESIAKLKSSTQRNNRVKYSTFRGNEVTRYGADMEDRTRQQDIVSFQQVNGHPGITMLWTVVYSSPNTTADWQQPQM